MRYSNYNVVIIGSGMSGLFLANKLCESTNYSNGILLVSKGEVFSGSSALAQGGIVSVIPELNKEDSVELHIKDTIQAGCGLNNIDTVKMVSQESSDVAQELIRFGVEFDRNEKNALNFTLEGAHSCSRILHAQGDSTGKVIEEVLSQRIKTFDNLTIYTNTMAIELLVNKDNVCQGVIVYDWKNKTFETIYSNCVVIATGGIGQVYRRTTNPTVSTGDGIAIANNAGAKVENMEFVQFHPTALFCKDKGTFPLVSESVRGEGGKLVDLTGEYFAKNYHHLADLAPRDVVARAITKQMEINKTDYVNLDISQIGVEKFKKRFPTITKLCLGNNIDLSLGLIPVIPAEHYFMGGIKTDLNAKTSVENLYAIGECASTGLHGANRLASNSLLECGVFANNLFEHITNLNLDTPKKFDEKIKLTIEKYNNVNVGTDENVDILTNLFNRLKTVMTENVGIVRTEKSLNNALEEISEIKNSISKVEFCISRKLFELKNALDVAALIVLSAIKRNKSIGAHYRADYYENTEINTQNETKKEHDELLSE